MTEKDKSEAGGGQDLREPLSAVNEYLLGRGLDTLEQLGEIPRKKGKQTQHDQLMRARIDALVRIVEVFAEDLLTAQNKADAQDERHIGLVRRVQAAGKALSHASGAAKVMWLVTCVLRNYSGSPEAFFAEEGIPEDGRVGTTYVFEFPCGVRVEYRPWREIDGLHVMLESGARQYFSVDYGGKVPSKEEEALVGFLMRHGMAAVFPPKVAPREDVTDPQLARVLTEAGIDPAKVTLHRFGNTTYMVVG